MKVKPTFFNSRNERLHWDYEDTNNWLFKIIYRIGTTCREQNYILRDLKQDKNIIGYIYKKIHQKHSCTIVVKVFYLVCWLQFTNVSNMYTHVLECQLCTTIDVSQYGSNPVEKNRLTCIKAKAWICEMETRR